MELASKERYNDRENEGCAHKTYELLSPTLFLNLILLLLYRNFPGFISFLVF